jgi:uncharacterized membrane protein YhaH (DUF805 family)/glutaredoxin
MAQQYRVVISGRTLSGGSLDEVRDAVGQAFRLQGEQLDRMLCGKPVVVQRGAPQEAAGKLQAKLQGLGLEASIEPVGEAVVAVPLPVPPVPQAPVSPPREASDAGADELFALTPPSVVVSAPAARSVAVSEPSVDGEGGEASPVAPGDIEVVCPKCGEGQPKRTLCRKCGLDMPRYLAAQQTAEREAREQRELEREQRLQSPGRAAGAAGETSSRLFGFGFSGRLGRLDYFSGSMLSTLIWLVFTLFAALSGKLALVGFGMFVSIIFALRCIALRLHDTGRSGWLSLVGLVPVLGGLMGLWLLFAGGEDDDNEYGAVPPEGGGRRALLVLLSIFVVSAIGWRSMSSSPDKALRFMAAMSAMQGKATAAEADDDDDEGTTQGAVTYASNNRIDLYVIAGCNDCEQMRSWLNANGLYYTTYSVDSDQHAAERLHSIIPGGGSVQLPVLEINGKVLPGNPPIDEVHRHLRQATP